jgi:O-antigen/teichoic acid export membrane protein
MDFAIQLKNKFIYVWGHAGFQKYFRNTGWMFLGRIFTLAISFFVSVYIARYLGPSNYGLFNYTISFVGLFGFISSLGLDNILNRELVKKPENKAILLGTSFYLKIIGSIVSIILIFIISLFITNDTFTRILIWLFSLKFIPESFNVLETYFNSQVLSKKVVYSQITGSIISAVLKLFIIYLNKGIFWLTLVYVVETVVVSVLLIKHYIKNNSSTQKWKFNTETSNILLKDSWPLIFSGISAGIYMKIDQVMIKHILGNSDVGVYSVAVKLSEVWYFIPGLITISVFPALIRSYKKSMFEFEKRMSRLYFFLFWLSIIISIFTSSLSSFIVEYLFGNQFAGSAPVLQIYIWSCVAIFIHLAIGKYILVKNQTKIYLLSTIFGAIINIILNLILIHKYGIVGSAYATLISYTLAILVLILFKETRKSVTLIPKSIIKFK